MSSLLPKPVLIAAALISIAVAGGVGGIWEYASYAESNLKIVCNLPGYSVSNPADVLVIVGVKDPSLIPVDGTWKFHFEGINGTTPWSSGDTISFHLRAGGTVILNLTFPGLSSHINAFPNEAALTFNATLWVWVRTYHVGMRSFSYTDSITNATADVPFSLGAARYC